MLESISLHKLERHSGVCHFLVVLVLALFVNKGRVWAYLDLVQIVGCSAKDIFQEAIRTATELSLDSQSFWLGTDLLQRTHQTVRFLFYP
jgi:hypothetical protein